MQTNYTLNFTNGVCTTTLPTGTYTYVSNSIDGYTDGTVDSFTITSESSSIALVVTAAGTLKILVKDDLGQDITSGKIRLASDESASTVYGDPVQISEGMAVFNHVPHSTTGVNFFLDQTESDTEHLPSAPKAVSMTNAVQEETLENPRKSISLTLTMKDKYFEGIHTLNGDLVVNG